VSASYLSDKQVDLLLKPVHPRRVGRHPFTGMSHMEGFDIRAELNRVFGFGRWDVEVTEQVLLREVQTTTSKGGDAWNVVYRTRVRLTVRTPDGASLSVQEATHIGESTVPAYGDAHGNAVTNSETYALRRCCINFGDQFGLSLYNKGSLSAVVRWTLVRPEAGDVDTDDVPEVNAEEGGDESGTVPPAADLTGWKARIDAATDGDGLDKILGDMQSLRNDGALSTEDAARIRGMLDACAAQFDRASRHPEETAGDAGAQRVAGFRERIAKGDTAGMRIQIAKAVHAHEISPDAANELVGLLKGASDANAA
jgi:hypothetical protein